MELLHDGREAWLRPDSPAAEPLTLDVHEVKAITIDTGGRWLLATAPGRCAVLDLDDGAACVLQREGVACSAFAAGSSAAPALWVAETAGGLRRLALPTGHTTRLLSWSEAPILIGAGDGPGTMWLIQGTSLLWIDAKHGTVLQRAELGDDVREVLPSPSRRYLWVHTRAGEGTVWRMPRASVACGWTNVMPLWRGWRATSSPCAMARRFASNRCRSTC